MNFHEQSTVRAPNNAKFYARFKWLGLGALAFGIYCVYDGAVAYPEQKVRSEAMIELAQETLSSEQLRNASEASYDLEGRYKALVAEMGKDEADWAKWTELAEQNGWPPEPPTKPRSDGDIGMQFVMATACGLAALYFFWVIWKTTGRWFEIDNDQVRTSGGLEFAASSVTEIDKRQWEDKGIARLKFEDGRGARRFIVDNYKYLKEETDAILYRIEQIAGADKIVGGAPEAPPELPAADDSSAEPTYTEQPTA